MRFLRIGVLFLLAHSAFPAEPKWIYAPSSDFEVYSTAGEGDTIRVLQYFERVRTFFEQTLGGNTKIHNEPVRIILFGSKKEFEPYRPNEFTAAFYTQVAGRDYIVLGGVSEDGFPIAVHEYVHLVAEHGNWKLPPWINEGLAELFSTLKSLGDKIIIGNLIPGRIYGLQQEKWVPLATILAAGHDSPYYNEKSKAGNLYNEGWAFTHMLELSTEYAPRFTKLLQSIGSGTPSQEAVESIYGKPIAAFDKEVQSYIRQERFTGAVVPVKMKDGPKVAVQAASMFDVKMSLLDLQNRKDKEDLYRKGLLSLASEYPQRHEPHSALAYSAWRSGRNDEALEQFKAALDLGSENPKMLWDYGRMAAQRGRMNRSWCCGGWSLCSRTALMCGWLLLRCN